MNLEEFNSCFNIFFFKFYYCSIKVCFLFFDNIRKKNKSYKCLIEWKKSFLGDLFLVFVISGSFVGYMIIIENNDWDNFIVLKKIDFVYEVINVF